MILQYKFKTIVGLLDSDGGFTIRILKRKNNQVGFSICVSFKQATKNRDVLDPISRQFNISTFVNTTNSKSHKATALNINFNTVGGEKFITMLNKNIPLNPAKRQDYLIALKVYNLNKMRHQSLISSHQNMVISIAMICLVYSTSNQISMVRKIKKRQITFDQWIKFLQPTKKGYVLGMKLGKQLVNVILLKTSVLKKYLNKSNIKLPQAYLVGFFIGDGSFQINFRFSIDKKKMVVEPFFTLTTGADEIDLLKGFRTTLGCGNISSARINNTAFRYKVSGWEKAVNVLVPIFQKYLLPSARQIQFNIFSKAVSLGYDRRHLTKKGFLQLINLAWYLNGLKHRHISKSVILHQAKVYFDSKSTNYKTKTHVRLRKRFLKITKKRKNLTF